MSPTAYSRMMKSLGFRHADIAKAFHVTTWASISWKTGRRPIPRAVELGLRSLVYDRLAGDLVRGEVDRIVAAAERGEPIPPLPPLR